MSEQKVKEYKRFQWCVSFNFFGCTLRITKDRPTWKYKKKEKPSDSQQMNFFEEGSNGRNGIDGRAGGAEGVGNGMVGISEHEAKEGEGSLPDTLRADAPDQKAEHSQ